MENYLYPCDKVLYRKALNEYIDSFTIVICYESTKFTYEYSANLYLLREGVNFFIIILKEDKVNHWVQENDEFDLEWETGGISAHLIQIDIRNFHPSFLFWIGEHSISWLSTVETIRPCGYVDPISAFDCNFNISFFSYKNGKKIYAKSLDELGDILSKKFRKWKGTYRCDKVISSK